MPYCAEKSESLILTSAIVSKMGVLMTLLLIGELVEAPSISALENGMEPLTETPPIPALLLLVPFPRVPGRKVRKDCQSGVPPVCGMDCSVSCGTVWEISAVLVSSRGAPCSWTTTVWDDWPTVSCTFRPMTPDVSVMGPLCTEVNPSFLKIIR